MKLSAGSPAVTVRRLLVVDDHPVSRQGFAQLLETEPDLSVAALAATVPEALAHLWAAEFDLAIVDISLRGLSGMDLLKDLKIHWPKMPVLVFSMHDEFLYAERALKAGARGYLMKNESFESVLGGIRRVLSGGLSLSEAANSRILSRVLDGGRESSLPGSIDGLLSNRELEVFRLIGRGCATRDIAQEMHISVKTVETYRAHIKQKLRLSTAPELMRAAIEWIKDTER